MVTDGNRHVGEGPARVVLADDDELLRALLRELLALLPHVTLVAEAADGIEALRLVARHYPDTVLLDVNMPRLDGFGVVEVLQSFLPTARVILHTSEPDDEKRRRARQLGVPLLDKLHLEATMDLVEEYAVEDDRSLAHAIEPLVLLALAGRAEGGVLVVNIDETIAYYNSAAASALGLPFPPTKLTLLDVHRRKPAHRQDGSPYPEAELPLNRALATRRPATDVVGLRGPDGTARLYLMAALPFLGPGGEVLGVGSYVTEVQGDTAQVAGRAERTDMKQ